MIDSKEFNIKLNLDKDFVECFNELKEKYGEEFLKLNGFSNSNLNFTDFIDNFIDSDNVANATIDPNANEGVKDIRALLFGMDKSHTKLLSFNKIFYELKKKYGIKEARKWLEMEWNGKIYTHDASTSSTLPYCYAYELQDVAKKGLFFLPKTNNEPPKHLTTFMANIRELIAFASNRSSGAVALPSFFVYTYYFWKKDVENNYYILNPEYYREQCFQQFIYEVNQIHTRIVQSAYTNLVLMDRNYVTEIFGDRQFPDGSYVIEFIEEIIEHQKVFMRTLSKIREKIFHTFPVLTYSLLYQNGKFQDEEFARWCNKMNLDWYDGNFYIGDTVTNIASCCRMVNNIKDMKNTQQFQSSIGGSLTEIGSIKVSTINLVRLALESNGDKQVFFSLLKDVLETNMNSLDCIRHIIIRNIEKGLLPNYSSGLIKLTNQSVTNGIIGIYETIEEFGMVEKDDFGNVKYTNDGKRLACEILDFINKIQDERNKQVEYRISAEIIPAESCAIKLAKKDDILYHNNKLLYSNQWIGLMEQATINERVEMASLLDKRASAGNILHINLQSKFNNEQQSWDMLNYIASKGVLYFAYNPKLSVCQHRHTFFGNICPQCGEEKIDEVSRIVGYLVPTSTYSKERKEEFKLRKWYNVE